MVITMVAMRVMQVTVYQIINVIAMRDGFVPAARAVDVIGGVCAARVLRGANLRVGGGNGDDVLVHVVAMRMVQMPVVQIINMAVVAHRGMAAVRAVLMRVVGMLGKGAG